MLNDEDVRVKVNAWCAVVDSLSSFPPKEMDTTIIPQLITVCSDIKSIEGKSAEASELITKGIGKLIVTLSQTFNKTTQELSPFLDFYNSLATMSKQCRYFCAYNFPAVLLVVGPSGYPTFLKETLDILVGDREAR